MNFKLERFLYLLMSFIIGICFFVFGAFILLLPWLPTLREATIEFITNHTVAQVLLGLGLALIGLALVIYAFRCMMHRYITIKTGKHPVTLDENVIRQYLQSYWKEKFPQSEIPFDVAIKKNFLQIMANLPPLPLEEQKIFLENVKNDFATLFGNILGYPNDVHFIANFQTEPSAAQQ